MSPGRGCRRAGITSTRRSIICARIPRSTWLVTRSILKLHSYNHPRIELLYRHLKPCLHQQGHTCPTVRCCKRESHLAAPFLSSRTGANSNRPLLSARVRNFADSTYAFLGLYVTTLFSVRNTTSPGPG